MADDPLAGEIASLRETGQEIGRPDFAERLVKALREELARLDALPRDDAFWSRHANDRATASKVGEYARQRLARDPSDAGARWAEVALRIARGANDGGLPLLAPLIAADVRVVADAVLIAEFIWDHIGLDPTHDLLAALATVRREDLERAAGDRAARIALRVLDGDIPYKNS